MHAVDFLAQRSEQISAWLASLGQPVDTPLLCAGDASVRRYWRVTGAAGSRIVMDAEPAAFDPAAFLARQAELAALGIRVPAVLARKAELGFVLLEDLGDAVLANLLDTEAAAKGWYLKALEQLVAMQAGLQHSHLPEFDAAFQRREMDICSEWYFGQHLGVTLTAAQQAVWDRSLALILARTATQPRVFMHRDYHSRNLMVVDGALAVIDFQDAVSGPVGYDVVSLLRDVYLMWEEGFTLDLAIRYWEMARAAGVPVHDDFSEFYTAFEWHGVQRHLKVLGLFARLNKRDGKPGYLPHIPRVLDYIRHVCLRYSELTPLGRLLLDLHGERIEVGYTF
ncbi:aminoglycoside phosphotransferase family protein [Chitinibacteraceae bacterium HSL-7]